MNTHHDTSKGVRYGSIVLTGERVALSAKRGYAVVALCDCGVTACVPEDELGKPQKTCGQHPPSWNTVFVVWSSTGDLMTLAAACRRSGLYPSKIAKQMSRGMDVYVASGGLFHDMKNDLR